MGHIFISYSHKDSKYVEQLEKKLIEEGFNVWIDHRIDYGTQWPKEIEKAVDTCDAYIVVMSENSANSIWVEREVIQAEKRNKPFFPLLLKGEVWFSLGNIQCVDVIGGALPPETFYRNLEKVIPRNKGRIPPRTSKSIKPRIRSKSFNPKIVLILGAVVIFIPTIFLIPEIGDILTPSQSTPQMQEPTETNVSDSDDDGFSDSVDLCPTQGDLGYGIDSHGCPKSPSESVNSTCPGALDTRVEVGMTFEVTTSQINPVPSLGVRPQPTLGAHKTFELVSGERMLVLDGPECSDDSYFWYITSSRGDGWVREANTEYYYLDPIQ